MRLDQLLQKARPTVAYPDEHIEEVVERMNATNVAHLSVVERITGRLLGYLSWKDIIRAQTGKSAGEQRMSFLRWQKPS